MLKVLGQSGEGYFSAPTFIAEEICEQYGVKVIGVVNSITEDLYAIYRDSSLINPGLEELLNFKPENSYHFLPSYLILGKKQSFE